MTSAANPPLVFWSRRLADDVDPLAVYASSTESNRSFLRVRDGGTALAGLGESASIELDSGERTDRTNRFQAAARARFLLGNRVRRLADENVGPSPVLLGGFAFDPQHQPDPDGPWARFPLVRLTLARILIRRTVYGAVWCTVVAPADSLDDSVGRNQKSWDAEIDAIEAAARAWSPPPLGDTAGAQPTAPGAPSPEPDLSDPSYPILVRRILDEIDADRMGKVVAARAVDVDCDLHPGDLTAALDQRFAAATVFAFTRDDHTFCGASPEMLARIDGRGIDTEAIAGSRPRGADAAEDNAIAHEMFSDVKERNEHSFVIEDLKRSLTGAGAALDDVAETRIRKLPGIQHLFTPLRARTSATSATAMAIVGALHPSAAVCGTPTTDALQFLRDNESLDRGWYAAPVGWTDLDGRGEFFVALRSGVLRPGRLRLFAGAGIVAGSDPAKELAETTMKLQAVLGPARSLMATSRASA